MLWIWVWKRLLPFLQHDDQQQESENMCRFGLCVIVCVGIHAGLCLLCWFPTVWTHDHHSQSFILADTSRNINYCSFSLLGFMSEHCLSLGFMISSLKVDSFIVSLKVNALCADRFTKSKMCLVFGVIVFVSRDGIGKTLHPSICPSVHACCQHVELKYKWGTHIHFGVWFHLSTR